MEIVVSTGLLPSVVFFLFLLLLIVIIILTMFWWTTESRTMHILWEFSYKEHTSNQADLKGVTLH